LGPRQIVGHVLERIAINLIQMRVRLFGLEGGTVIHLTLTDRLLITRVLRWHWLLRKHEVWEEWEQQNKGHGFHGPRINRSEQDDSRSAPL
jgi:hypothetical protein